MSRKRVNPWKTHSTETVYDNPWIQLQHHEVTNPAGKPGIYGKVCFKSQAVGIIPVDENGNTWLVGQHRYTLDAWSWEIPMGGSPLAEDCTKTAARELEEETGLVAGELIEIMHLHTSNSITDEEGRIYLARNLTSGKQSLEETEDIEIQKLTLKDAVQMAQDGRISDSISVAGLLYVALNAKQLGLTQVI